MGPLASGVDTPTCAATPTSTVIPVTAPAAMIPEGLVPERRCKLEFRLQPMVERASCRFAYLLPDEIGTHRDFIFGYVRTSIGQMH